MARRVFNELLDQLQNKFILLETSKKLVSGLFCNQELCRWPSCVVDQVPNNVFPPSAGSKSEGSFGQDGL